MLDPLGHLPASPALVLFLVRGHTSQLSEVSSGRDLQPRFRRRLSVGACPAGRSNWRKSKPPPAAFSESMMCGCGREDGSGVLATEQGCSRGQAVRGRRRAWPGAGPGEADDGRGDGDGRAGDGVSDSRELRKMRGTDVTFLHYACNYTEGCCVLFIHISNFLSDFYPEWNQ